MIAPNRPLTKKGRAAPSARPAATPISATARNSISATATTSPPAAPIAFNVAKVALLRSTKPCAALATPTPPTINEVKPIKARNSVKRSRFLEKAGEILPRPTTSQPASGKVFLAAARKALTALSLGGSPPGFMTTRVVQRTSEPGWTRPVWSSAASETSTRGARPRPEPRRSGSDSRAARICTLMAPMASVSPIFTLSRSSAASSTAAPNTPSFCASAACGVMSGANSARPIAGQDESTALISTSAASPASLRAMARIVATSESAPRAARYWLSAGDNCRWISEKAASPPRIARPSRDNPSARLRAKELTPTIVATPSATQARKMRKPAKPPRRSRKARRKSATVTQAPSRTLSRFGGEGDPMPRSMPARGRTAKVETRRLGPPLPRSGGGYGRGRRWPMKDAHSRQGSRRRQRFDSPGAQADRPVAARGEVRIMGDEDERRAALGAQFEEKIDDRLARRFVEIAGRFVGDEDGRPRRQSSGERDALLLAARKLRRIMSEAAGKADRGELGLGAVKRVGRAGELQRRGDVLQRRHGRNEME